MQRSEYQKYLASREWAVLREQVRRRSGGTCERCRRHPHEQTHHLTYERVGAERLDDLLAVCSPCHEFLSAKRDRDPARCTYFLAGPVLETAFTGWQQHLEGMLEWVNLFIPLRAVDPTGDPSHGWSAPFPSEVLNSNIGALERCCGVVAYMDEGNRVGTVVDVMLALGFGKRVILYDATPPGEEILDRCGHGVGCECFPQSEAWYLGEAIMRAGSWYMPQAVGAPCRLPPRERFEPWRRQCRSSHEIPVAIWEAFGGSGMLYGDQGVPR